MVRPSKYGNYWGRGTIVSKCTYLMHLQYVNRLLFSIPTMGSHKTWLISWSIYKMLQLVAMYHMYKYSNTHIPCSVEHFIKLVYKYICQKWKKDLRNKFWNTRQRQDSNLPEVKANKKLELDVKWWNRNNRKRMFGTYQTFYQKDQTQRMTHLLTHIWKPWQTRKNTQQSNKRKMLWETQWIWHWWIDAS